MTIEQFREIDITKRKIEKILKAGANVILAVSDHWPPETWNDSHSQERTTSGQDGSWEIRVSTPFVRFRRSRLYPTLTFP